MKSLLFQSEKSALGFEGSSLSLQSVENSLDPSLVSIPSQVGRCFGGKSGLFQMRLFSLHESFGGKGVFDLRKGTKGGCLEILDRRLLERFGFPDLGTQASALENGLRNCATHFPNPEFLVEQVVEFFGPASWPSGNCERGKQVFLGYLELKPACFDLEGRGLDVGSLRENPRGRRWLGDQR